MSVASPSTSTSSTSTPAVSQAALTSAFQKLAPILQTPMTAREAKIAQAAFAAGTSTDHYASVQTALQTIGGYVLGGKVGAEAAEILFPLPTKSVPRTVELEHNYGFGPAKRMYRFSDSVLQVSSGGSWKNSKKQVNEFTPVGQKALADLIVNPTMQVPVEG